LPFTSKSPDGLQTLTENSGSQQQPFWNGLMADYSASLSDPYISTLVAGLFGTGIVAVAGFGIGTIATPKNKGKSVEKCQFYSN
jgi:hypothetical protein